MTVRERIARLLCKLDGKAWEMLRESANTLFHAVTQREYLIKADEILDIRDEQGNKMLLERDPDQSLPQCPYEGIDDIDPDSINANEVAKDAYDDAQMDMLDEGWVKVNSTDIDKERQNAIYNIREN